MSSWLLSLSDPFNDQEYERIEQLNDWIILYFYSINKAFQAKQYYYE